MPVKLMFSLLIRHCSTDVTSQLNFSSVSELPVTGGIISDYFPGCLHNGAKVILKIPTRRGSAYSQRQGILRAAHELYVWSRCNHPNILPLIGATIHRGSITLVSPWMLQSNLHAWRQPNPLAGPDYLGICVQIAEGLSYLHSVGILHGDVQGIKILMSDDMIPKFCDFGNAALLNPYEALPFDNELQRRATLRWAAPEILMNAEKIRLTSESDVYALGMTILEAITGEFPWGMEPGLAITANIRAGIYPQRPQIYFPLEDEWANLTWDLLTQCWDQKPENRPTASEVRDRLKDIIARTGGPSAVVSDSKSLR
ncbi:unnamed protein product [Rhizoctonia solani]|uniref:Protein kinase domain-containing protein n=1 Tax=Rhizoctonia solani TaxID=456999 RepID=A0A8H3B3D7_9AGAM|nr:unnamed protein product [Rhizoctonia solani]